MIFIILIEEQKVNVINGSQSSTIMKSGFVLINPPKILNSHLLKITQSKLLIITFRIQYDNKTRISKVSTNVQNLVM